MGVKIAMDCLSLRSALFVLAFLFVFAGSVSAQDSAATLDSVLQRLERLEQDNQTLREKVAAFEDASLATDVEPSLPQSKKRAAVASQSMNSGNRKAGIYQPVEPRTLFASGTSEPLLTENDVRSIVTETVSQQTTITEPHDTVCPEDSMQDKKLTDLDRALKALQDKANKKTYPSITVNGVFQADAGWIHQDNVSQEQYGDIRDGSDFRRARLSARGSVTELTNYFFQMDFGFFGRPTFTDVWLEQTKVPLFGNVRIGQWKQPFGLETVSSFRYTTFMERSVLFQPFTPFRHIGIGFYDHSDDLSMTWAASVFRTGQDQFGATLSDDGGYGTSERLTWVPSWECNGKNYLHLGVGHFFNSPPNDTINFRTIPEFYVGANAPGARPARTLGQFGKIGGCAFGEF